LFTTAQLVFAMLLITVLAGAPLVDAPTLGGS
jgi:hypothetical protein